MPAIVAANAPAFQSAPRVHRALTAAAEKRLLEWLAQRAPASLTSDQLTAMAVLAQIAAGVLYACARTHPYALLGVNLCLLLNWLGDSLDGTLARVRRQQRPRFGFYVDHVADVLGAMAMMCGLAASGFVHWPVAMAMLLGFLLLAAESYLATYTLARFELSPGLFGPTEVRILLAAGNFALLRSPWATVLGHRLLLFDLGGAIAAVCMFGTAAVVIARHTAALYREEPLP